MSAAVQDEHIKGGRTVVAEPLRGGASLGMVAQLTALVARPTRDRRHLERWRSARTLAGRRDWPPRLLCIVADTFASGTKWLNNQGWPQGRQLRASAGLVGAQDARERPDHAHGCPDGVSGVADGRDQ